IDYCGSIEKAIQKASEYVINHKFGLKIEVEARTLEDVQKVLAFGKGKVFRIMLDNFSIDQLREAVKMVNGQMETEASGGINFENVISYAETGVDFVSIGSLIHQARSLDLSLKAIK
ncbi:MAG: nicotinate-nucleotide diphosphorylase, partial [Chitinophagaceae bacterium]